MFKDDYSWCFDDSALKNDNSSVYFGWGGSCGSEDCDIETCGRDCGSDCYDDGCGSYCMFD